MPSVRVSDVRAALTTLLHDDVARVAINTLMSKSEQASAPIDIRDAAQRVRTAAAAAAGGFGLGVGARVHVDEVEQELLQAALRLIGVVNQPSGSGKAFLSRAEVDSVVALDPLLGGRVQKAWQIVRAAPVTPVTPVTPVDVDVDVIARAHAIPTSLPADEVFLRFASENEAANYVEPSGKTVRWLVVERDTASSTSFVSGTNDLWSQRFDVDKRTGAVTITAEH